MFGGRSRNLITNDLLLLNLDQRNSSVSIISTCGKKPTPRYKHSSSVLKEYMYIYGGISTDDNFLNDFYRLKISSLSWECIEFPNNLPKPLPRIGHILLADSIENLYIIGGHNEDQTSEVINFKLRVKKRKIKWTIFAESSKFTSVLDRSYFAASIYRNIIIFVGGMNKNGNGDLSFFDALKIGKSSAHYHSQSILKEDDVENFDNSSRNCSTECHFNPLSSGKSVDLFNIDSHKNSFDSEYNRFNFKSINSIDETEKDSLLRIHQKEWPFLVKQKCTKEPSETSLWSKKSVNETNILHLESH